jgi:hypothetical protein
MHTGDSHCLAARAILPHTMPLDCILPPRMNTTEVDLKWVLGTNLNYRKN